MHKELRNISFSLVESGTLDSDWALVPLKAGSVTPNGDGSRDGGWREIKEISCFKMYTFAHGMRL